LKQREDVYRDLVTRLFSRRTKRWNNSPALDSIVDLVVEHCQTENVVVLADNKAQIDELETQLEAVLSDSIPLFVVTGSLGREAQRERLDEFDRPEGSGVLFGTGDLIGEGVDMQYASVAINMATGGVNADLVQRIGRVLRNPVDEPKHAIFYNVVGVPPSVEAAVPREDGRHILEKAAAFCALGARFDKLPGFARANQIDATTLTTLLRAGAEFVGELDSDGSYEWPEAEVKRESLEEFVDLVLQDFEDADEILAAWEDWSLAQSGRGESLESSRGGGDTSESSTRSPTADDEPELEAEVEDLVAAGEVGGETSEESITETERDCIRDIVNLQPTKIAEFQRRWDLDDGSAVHQYLESKLGDYYYLDDDNLIWATDSALELVNESTERSRNGDSESPEGEEDTSYPRTDRPEGARVSRGDVIGGLRSLADELGALPQPDDIDEHAAFGSSAVTAHFETVSEALQVAGVDELVSNERPSEPAPETSRSTTGDDEIFWDEDANGLRVTEDSASQDGSTEDDGCEESQLDQKIDEWKSQLLDLTRRNKLVSFKSTKTKSLPLDDCDPETLAESLFEGEDVYIQKRREGGAGDQSRSWPTTWRDRPESRTRRRIR
jgi:hypothetical protein